MVKESLHSQEDKGGCELKEATSSLKLLKTSTPVGSKTVAGCDITATAKQPADVIVLSGPESQGFGQPFGARDVKQPKIKQCKANFPRNFTGHLPPVGTITDDDKERLEVFYEQTDKKTYLLQKNLHKEKGKFYIMVENALSLCLWTYVNNMILNFAWKQCSEQYLKGQSKGNLRVCFFPTFFITRLLGEGGEETHDYKHVSKWLQKVFGKDTSPLQYDVIVFLRHQAKHWWTYLMLPKAKHLKGLDSFGMNDQLRNALQALWRWLNDDLHFHHGLGTPLDGKKWHITANCGEGAPRQTNMWDCGLYAIHMGFCCALQAPFNTEITPHQIHTYYQKRILYLLDDDKTNDIMLPDCNWHQTRSQLYPVTFLHRWDNLQIDQFD